MTTLLSIALCLLLQSSALLGLGLIVLRLARRRGPAVQSLIGRATLAGVALALLLAGPLAGHVKPLWSIKGGEPTPRQVAAPPGTGRAGGKAVGESRLLDGAFLGQAPVGRIPVSGPLTHAPLTDPPPIIPLNPLTTFSAPPPVSGGAATCRGVGSLWAAVTALLLLWLAFCQCHLIRLRRSAFPVTSGLAAEMLAALTAHPPALLTHPSVRSPFLAGVRRPAIFLPTAYGAEFDPASLRAILAHEMAHLARRDNAWVLAARLLTALLWPQPLLWVLCRRLEQTGEEACDQAVLAQDCPPRAYADCLLTLAERHPLGRRERALGVGVAPFRSSLGRRIGRILDKGTHAMSAVTLRLRLTAAALAVAAALGGAFLVSSAPAQSPPQSPKPATNTESPGLTRYLATLTSKQRQSRAAAMQDAMNLKEIGLAIARYAQDHKEHYPDADHWMDQIAPYLEGRPALFDPLQTGVLRYGYAFNRNCSGKPLAAFAHPWETVAVFDSTIGTRNASDTGHSLRTITAGAAPGSNYVFVDGHVKWIRADARPLFAVQHSTRPSDRPHRRAGLPQAPPAFSQADMAARRDFMAALSASHPDPELSNARFLAGLTPVQGPGVVVTLRDSKKSLPALRGGLAPPSIIHDSDINQVVNELKAAGAEAVAVSGQRLVATSPIRCAGPTIFVNNMPQTPPFAIEAIGTPKALATALNLPGGVASQIKAFDPAMFSVREADALKLPAYTSGSRPRYARPAGLTDDSIPSTGLVKQSARKGAGQPPIMLADYAPKTIPDFKKPSGSHASARMTDFDNYLNMKQVALAIWQYAYHHKDRFPDADRWMDEIKPYLKTEYYYHDPIAPAFERYSYAYNRSLSGAADDRVSDMSETIMLFESTLNVRNASDTGQSLLRPARHQGQLGFVSVNIGGPGQNSHPSFALHIAPPNFFAEASPEQLVRLQKRMQARLVSEQNSLTAANQQFEGELRRALPQVETSRLAQARMLEMQIGLQVMGLQNIEKLRRLPSRNSPESQASSRHMEVWTEAQLRPLLAQEARLLPDVPGAQRARLHSVAASLTNLQFNMEFSQEEIKQFSRERQRRR